MPNLLMKRRLVNPGRRKKRKLSALQKMFFGSKRQRAAVKNAGKQRRRKLVANPRRRRRRVVVNSAPRRRRRRVVVNRRRRRKNVGQILTVGLNPGRKRRRRKAVSKKRRVTNMARTRRRRSRVGNRRRRRVMHNPVPRRRRRRAVASHRRRRQSNPRVIYRSRKARRGNRGRRSNPGILSGSAGQVVGVIGGATLTAVLSGFIPAGINQGIMGYFATGLLAYLQGKLVGKVTKSPSLGKDLMIGGYTFVALKVLKDFFPSLAGQLGLSGLGIISPSSFYVPQVNQGNSMTSFVLPAGVPVPQPAGMAGLGRMATRRVGRMR